MRVLTKREKNIFVVCVITGVLCLVYYGLYKPYGDKMERAKLQIMAQKGHLKKNQKVLAEAASYEKLYENYHQQFKQEGSNEQVMSSILAEIEEAAGSLALRISDLKPMQVKKEDSFNRFSVSLIINSKLDEIIKLLYILQKEPHLFAVDRVSFDKSSNREDEKNIMTRLVLSKIFVP